MNNLTFSVILTLIVFCGCSSNTSKAASESSNSFSTTVLEIDEVVMECSPKTVTPTSDTLRVTISNNTESVLEFGDMYEIEHFDAQKWNRFPFNDGIGFNLVGYKIMPKSSMNLTIYLYPQFHKYNTGMYRIVKKVSSTYKEYVIYSEFKVE